MNRPVPSSTTPFARVLLSPDVKSPTLLARLKRLKPLLGFVAASCAVVSGCDAGDPAEISAETAALRTDQWRAAGSLLGTVTVTNDPAVCSNAPGYVALVRGSDQKFYARRAELSPSPNWSKVDDSTFSSSPTCTMQFPYPATTNTFVIAGRGTDGKIYTRGGPAVPSKSPQTTPISPPNPTFQGSWSAVSSDQYSTRSQDNSGNNGVPALSSNGIGLAMSFVNGQTVYVQTRALPYAAGNWNARVAAPKLAGASAIDVPAITYLGAPINKFLVMVRATVGGTSQLHWIYFKSGKFEGTWTQAFIPMAIESAPAIEWDADFTALTVYFVSGGGIVQTSASRPGDLGATPFFNTAATAGTVIASGASPRVVYGGGIEGSHRTLGIRGYTSDLSRADQLKSILIAHTFAGEDPFEN